ncbi:MAG TPA: septal ring lytic transglycosylase RlpA family protein [bacterium]|nr:septal ring lytic transglycosylase RlpA family protein [bacterium]
MIKPKAPVLSLCLCGFVSALGLIGCVPIRQMAPLGHGAPSTGKAGKTEFESPDDYKNAGKDAWKDEMEGVASWYGVDFNGRLTASGEVYDMYKFTAAHKTLPLGTRVRVTNLENGKTTEVTINDRGPYVKGRVIDLSRTAGRAIGMRESGTAKVKLEVTHWP